MSIYAVLTPATACRALREAGFRHHATHRTLTKISQPYQMIDWRPRQDSNLRPLA